MLEFLSLINWHFSKLFPIFLITNKDDYNFWFTLGHDFLKPRFEIQKSIHTRDIIRQHYAMSSFVEYLSDRLERLLASSIPNLQFEHLLLQSYHQRTKLYPYCHFMIFLKLVCGDPVHEATLSDCRISNYDQLEQSCLLNGFHF